MDVQFTSESLAKALGISAAKTVLCKHLSRKFAELIGPVAAQRKVDAMQSKNFIPLDPTELPPTRIRSRSVVGRRGPKKGETLLLPVEPDIATGSSISGLTIDFGTCSSISGLTIDIGT